MKQNHAVRVFGLVLGALVAAYVLVYVGLSLGGHYSPIAVGTNGVKDWGWTPRGFADDSGVFRPAVGATFLPLYWLDRRYWHKDR